MSFNSKLLHEMLQKWNFKLSGKYEPLSDKVKYYLEEPIASFDSIEDALEWILEEFEDK